MKYSNTNNADELDRLIAHTFNRLRGKLCGYIESLMLSERTEHALISVFKSMPYDCQSDIRRLLDTIETQTTQEK